MSPLNVHTITNPQTLCYSSQEVVSKIKINFKFSTDILPVNKRECTSIFSFSYHKYMNKTYELQRVVTPIRVTRQTIVLLNQSSEIQLHLSRHNISVGVLLNCFYCE